MAEHRPSFTAVNEPSSAPSAPSAPSEPSGPHASNNTSHQTPKDTSDNNSAVVRASQDHERASKEASVGNMVEGGEEEVPPTEPKITPAPPSSAAPSAPTPNPGLASIARPSHNDTTSAQPQPSQRINNYEVRRPSILNDILDPAPAQATTSPVMGSHKRKRSVSAERDRHNHQRPNQSSPPHSPKSGGVARAIQGGIDDESISPRQAYPPPPSKHPHAQPSDSYQPPPTPQHAYPPPPDQPNQQAEAYPRTNGISRNDYEPPLDPSIASTQERPYYSESRLAEALQRENRSYDPGAPRDDYPPSEDQGEEEDQQNQQEQFGTYGGSREAGTADIDRKRRKRIFSNRTKTGCMTCRRRKKKCDETHPECKFEALHSMSIGPTASNKGYLYCSSTLPFLRRFVRSPPSSIVRPVLKATAVHR